MLEQRGIRRDWLHDMLFQYRGLQLGVHDDYERFVANTAHAQGSGALGPRAASALRGMAERNRAAKPRPKVAKQTTREEAPEGMLQWGPARDFGQALTAIERSPNEATVNA